MAGRDGSAANPVGCAARAAPLSPGKTRPPPAAAAVRRKPRRVVEPLIQHLSRPVPIETPVRRCHHRLSSLDRLPNGMRAQRPARNEAKSHRAARRHYDTVGPRCQSVSISQSETSPRSGIRILAHPAQAAAPQQRWRGRPRLSPRLGWFCGMSRNRYELMSPARIVAYWYRFGLIEGSARYADSNVAAALAVVCPPST